MSTVEQRCAGNASLVAWVGSRPASVRALAVDWPMGRLIELPDHGEAYVIGWTEDDMVVFSRVFPGFGADYDTSMAMRFHVCASHLRELGL